MYLRINQYELVRINIYSENCNGIFFMYSLELRNNYGFRCK